MPSPHPCIGFFPALPLESTLVVGEWMAGAPPADTPWRSARFKELAETHIASFSALGFTSGAMLWHGQRGFDGTPPSPQEFGAIQAAVSFAAFDANDHLPGWRKGDCLATTENTELHVQPIDEQEGLITHVEGGALRSTWIGGWKIGERSPSVPEAMRAIKGTVRASTKLAKALFDALMVPGSGSRNHIAIALEWHRVAMTNASAVTVQQRLIALKTAFEALFGTSNSWRCAKALRALFEKATAAHRELLPWAGVLWSPKERTDLRREYTTEEGKAKQVIRSELEDWLMTLADARNSIIHEGVVSVSSYGPPPERPLSRYTGQLFWTGERILREAIKAMLGPEILLCGLLKERALWDRIWESAQKKAAEHEQTTPSGPQENAPNAKEPARAKEPSIPPPRDLAKLLSELGCEAANQVVLRPSSGTPSHSLEAAEERARELQNYWGAEAGGRSISITLAERDLLEAAGAEHELPGHFTECD